MVALERVAQPGQDDAVEPRTELRPEPSPVVEIVLALAGVAVAVLSRGGALLDYVGSHTGATFVAFGLAGVCAALLTAVSVAAE